MEPSMEQYIFKNVINPRISQIKKTKKSFAWNDFQIAAEKLSNRALLDSTLRKWEDFGSLALDKGPSR